jgi:hypothetical protein
MVVLLVQETASQQIRGPIPGFLPAGARRLNRGVSMGAPRTISFPMPAEPRKKTHRDIEYPMADQPAPGASAVTSYVLDSSVVHDTGGVPPLILASFPGPAMTEYAPPDPVIAAGPRHLIVAANEHFRILTRDGSVLATIDAGAWHEDVSPGSRPFDPRVLYDHFAGRFIMLWLQQSDHRRSSHYLLSISESDDPTGLWTRWALPGDVDNSTPSDSWADNACLGFDSTTVYIVSNQYTFDQWEFVHVRLRVLPKRELYSVREGDIRWDDYTITGARSVRPAVVYGQSDAYYLLEARDAPTLATGVVLYRLNHTASGDTLTHTFVPVAPYNRTMNAGQPGGGDPIDVRWSYIQSEVQVRNGSLHAAFPIANPASPGYSAIRYLSINTATGTTTQDITFGSPGHWYYFPAVAVNRNEDVAITFARSGTDEYPGCFFTWRRASDGPLLRPSVPIQPGWVTYQHLIDGRNRWGDYSGAAVDPTDWTSFWLMGEYADAPDGWGTWVNAVRLEPFQAPRLVVDRRSVDLGYPGLDGPPARAHLTIRNGGASDLIISGLTCSGPFAVVDPPALPVTLALYDSLAMEIAFSPGEAGLAHGELLITSNDVDHPGVSVPLQGTGIAHSGGTAGVIYTVQEGETEDILHFLGTRGDIQSSRALGRPGLHSLTVDMASGRLYGAASDNHGTMVMKIDGVAGSVHPSYPIPLHGVYAICVIDPDTFYCGTNDGKVYRFIPSTGELVPVASRVGVGFSGLVRSSTPDQLWASAWLPVTNDTLYAINVRSGSIVPIGTTGISVRTESICRASDGGLLGLVGSSLVRIDTLSGNSSVQALVALDGLRAIAEGMLVTGVAEGSDRSVPLAFNLGQNYPNPFNPSTTITYSLPVPSHVVLTVFNALGQQVAVLVQGEADAGHHDVTFDASGLSTGVYFCRMSAGGYSSTKKLMLTR